MTLALVCHAQDRIRVSWSNPPTTTRGTYNKISVSATIVAGQRGFDAGGNVERILSLEMFANGESMETESDPGEEPPPFGLTLPVVYSSLHWNHNTAVLFSVKVSWKLVDDTVHDTTVPGAPTTTYNRSVVYGIVTGSGGTADMAELLGWNQDLASEVDNNWTEAEFLAALAGRTMSSLTAHGGIYSSSGEGFQLPPNPVDDPPHIKASDISPVVQDTVGDGYPPMHFSLLVGCHAGESSVYAMSWLSGSTSTTNKAVIGFKDAVGGLDTDVYLGFFQSIVNNGYTCYEAAYEAWSLWWSDDFTFDSAIAFYGDKSARIRYVYDGKQKGIHTKWSRKGT